MSMQEVELAYVVLRDSGQPGSELYYRLPDPDYDHSLTTLNEAAFQPVTEFMELQVQNNERQLVTVTLFRLGDSARFTAEGPLGIVGRGRRVFFLPKADMDKTVEELEKVGFLRLENIRDLRAI